MPLWSRISNVFRPGRLNSQIDEELQSHIESAIEEGRDPAEARRSLGPALRLREESRDIRLLPWLDSLRADIVFGWRQLVKRKVTSGAAILSLALAAGACTSAFRLIDALFLRQLPVAGADRLYSIAFQSPSATDSSIVEYDSCSYPMFRRMREAVRDSAESVAISMYTGLADLTYGSNSDMEKGVVQYVSGDMFRTFGLRPAAGRLLTSQDDGAPGANPYAVLSYDYWTRRFAHNPDVIGRAFHLGNAVIEIVGVSNEGFTGTETGWTTDIFLPMAMKNPRTLASLNNFWMRTLFILKPGVSPAPLQEKLRAVFLQIQEERVKSFPSQTKRDRDRFFQERLFLERAGAGRSNLQRQYGQALAVLGLLVVLVLVIACVNVANLMVAQAAARAREMALRVSIGAGRARLIQLVLVESAWIALLSVALGAVLAWWSAPLVVTMINPPAYQARLILPADWRFLVFSLMLACGVMFFFGLAPAIRASSVKPVIALREAPDSHARGRLMYSLIAVQVAFCFVVQLSSSLFVTTFEKLTHQPTGFSADGVLNVEAITSQPLPPAQWEAAQSRLRAVPGVDSVALIGWPLMSGESSVGNISINAAPPADVFSDFVTISPGWASLMKIPLLGGRDFRAGDANPTVAIVNQAFARQYFAGENPVGKWFDRVEPGGGRSHFQIVGYIRDARSRDRVRVPIRPTAYIPFRTVNAAGMVQPVARGTFVVRAEGVNPLALAGALRRQVSAGASSFVVHDVRTQTEFNQTDTVRERLLAVIAVFFAGLAALLAAIGLYGVLDYSVLRRSREIAIRKAIGAGSLELVRQLSLGTFAIVSGASVAGFVIALAMVQFVESLIYQAKLTDASILFLPVVTIMGTAALATLPALLRAIRIDPAVMLRSQ